MSETMNAAGNECLQSAEKSGQQADRTAFKIWADVLNYGKQTLKNAGIAEADLDAWYLFEQIFGISRAQYFMCAREKITGRSANGIAAQEKSPELPKSGVHPEHAADSFEAKMSAYDAALKKRAAHIPLQQILGQQEFMGLSFFVNEHVLIPRQDTETLVELVLNEQKNKQMSILDMCTGSGCIAVSLKKLGGYRHVEAADISKEALKVAEKNAETILGECCFNESGQTQQNCLSATNSRDNFENNSTDENKVTFRHSDMFHSFSDSEQFDVIVSNPPYIPSAVIEELEPEVRDHEPRGALDGTADGLCFYRILAKECGKHLTPGGHVYFEIGYDQGQAVKHLLDAHEFKDTRVIQDLAGKDRIVCGTWQTAGV